MATIDTILNIRVEGTDSMVKLKSSIDTTTAELKKLKAEGKSTGESQDKFNAKIVTAETKLKGLRGELNKGKTELVKNAKAAGDTSKSYDAIAKQTAQLSAQARKLSDPLGKNKVQFQTLTAKINSNTASLKAMDAQMGRSNRNVGNYRAAITSVASAVGIAIIAFKTFQRVMGTFVEFQFEMAQVGAISGATASELEMLTATAKNLGATTAFTAGEVASLQKELSKLGFNPEEIEGMTAATLDLAYAFGNDIAETGQTVGVVLNSYGMEATEATRVTDVLATAFSKSALDLQKFNTAFPKVGAISSQLGFSLEGTTAILGKLSDAGLEASTAGTSLRSVFLKLADGNSSLSQKLGGSVDSIETLLPALQELYEDGTDVEEMLGLTDKRAVTAFATMVSGADDIGALTNELINSEGAAAGFAEVMRNTMRGSLDEAGSAADGFAISLFESLEPAITLLVKGITLLFTALNGLIKNFKSVALGVAAYGAVVLATSITQGTFITALLTSKTAAALYNIGVKVAAVGTNIFSAAIRANPLGLLAAGLAVGASMLFSFGQEAGESAEEMEDLTKATKEEIKVVDKLGDIRKKNSTQQVEEIAKLKALSETIKKSTLSLEEREKALEDYNKLAGTSISNLQDEKSIVDQLEQSYDNAVDAIKRMIILQSSKEQVTELIEQQLEVEERLRIAKKVAEEAETKSILTKENLAKIDKERADAGIRSSNEIIEANENLAESDKILFSQKEKDFKVTKEIYEGINDLAEITATESYSRIDNELTRSLELQRQLEDQAESEKTNAAQLTDVITKANENKKVSAEASSDAVVSAITNVNNAENEYAENLEVVSRIENENLGLADQITKVYSKQAEVLEGLNTSTNLNSFSKGKLKSEYEKLGIAVKSAEADLKKEITERENNIKSFLKTEEAKEMGVEERAKRVAEIENDSSKKITDATDKVISTKQDLKVVDDAIKKTYEEINKAIGGNVDAMDTEVKKAQDKIDLDKKQIEVLKDLEDAGAKLAHERISLALKVAKAELDLALKTAEASDQSTQAQVDNIKKLQGEIIGFQNDLDGLGSESGKSGFMTNALFGTDEDGNPITGEDFVEAVLMTMNLVMDILGEVNALQNERLNTQLQILEGNKEEEIKIFENSAEYQVLSEEQKNDRLESIQTSFDAEMLSLKIDQFEKDKKLSIAEASINAANSVMGILGGKGTGNVIADAVIKAILIAATGVTFALQVAQIKAQAPPTAELGGLINDSFFASGGMVNGKSHSQGGEMFSVGGRVVELEGGEAVINKKSTSMFKPLLSSLNEAGGGRKFADGGMVFGSDNATNDSSMIDALINQINNQQVLLVEADVTNSQRNVKNIESRISF